MMKRTYPKHACWDQVDRRSRPEKQDEITCKHCGVSWHHNDRERVLKHLRKCSALPPHLHIQYKGKLVAKTREPSQPTQGNDSLSIDEQIALQQSCTQWLYDSGLPMSTTEHPAFRAFMNSLKPAFQPPTPQVSVQLLAAQCATSALCSVSSLPTDDIDSSRVQVGRMGTPSDGVAASKSRHCPDRYVERTSYDIQQLQHLLPDIATVYKLVDYHEQKLAWYHWSYCAPLFRNPLSEAIRASRTIQLDCLDLRWASLLYAILCASITCSDESTARSWGYSMAEKKEIGRKWFDASMSCLNLSQYMARPHINSVQTILVLSISAHLLGHSSELFVLIGVAVRLAQSLGLHKLPHNTSVDEVHPMTEIQKDACRERELGRKLWAQLKAHDGCGVAITNMYFLHAAHSDTILPRRVHDQSMALIPEQTPVLIDWALWFVQLSAFLVEYRDIMAKNDDEDETYRSILLLDSKIRAHRFSVHTQEEPESDWLRWAKQEAIVCRANKLSFIHRAFLGKSFADDRYTYSRWASVDASRTVIRTVEKAWNAEKTRPKFWNDQAHLVAACIIVYLDMFNRCEQDAQIHELRSLIDCALLLLDSQVNSVLATKGSRLIRSLLGDGQSSLNRFAKGPMYSQATRTWPLESDADCGPESQVQSKGDTEERLSEWERNGFEARQAEADTNSQHEPADLSWLDLLTESYTLDNGFDAFMM